MPNVFMIKNMTSIFVRTDRNCRELKKPFQGVLPEMAFFVGKNKEI